MEQFVLRSRLEAGIMLAEKLARLGVDDPIVLAIPRGGVIVAEAVAKRLGADLDIVTPKKIPAPGNPELALGAAMPDGSFFLDRQSVAISHASEEYIDSERKRAVKEAARRMGLYRKERNMPLVNGRNVILVDDGIATGSTIMAAAEWIRKNGPKRLIIAVPVLPRSALPELRHEADEVVFLEAPEMFYAIGQFYKEFEQVADAEVIKILEGYWKA